MILPAQTLGVFVGLGLVVGIALLVRLVNTTSKNIVDYDVEQQLIRGKAYRYSFITIMVLVMAAMVYSLGHGGKMLSTFMLGVIILCAGIGVFAIYSIWHNSFFSFGTCPVFYLIIAAFISGINFYCGIVLINDEIASYTDGAAAGFSNLAVGTLFGTIFVTMLLRKVVDKISWD